MFVGCFEISTIVIVKHAQSIGIIRAFCLPVCLADLLRFSVPWGAEEIAGLQFAGGGESVPRLTL